MDIPFDIFQEIFQYLNFITKIRIRQISKKNLLLDITDFYYIPINLRIKLSDNILVNYPKLKYLHAGSNPNITKINYLTNLEKLNISCFKPGNQAWVQSGVTSNQLLNLTNITWLNLCENPIISNISYLTNLKTLNLATHHTYLEIQNSDLLNLNLTSLNLSGNHQITKISHLTNLKKLNINSCDIPDFELKNMDLIRLDAYYNQNIYNISHLTNLKHLDISHTYINSNNLKNINPFYLNVNGCSNITDINHMTNLTHLRARYEWCGLSNSGINKLKIKLIIAWSNPKIIGCFPENNI